MSTSLETIRDPNHQPVNDALRFPLSDAFERDVKQMIDADAPFVLVMMDVDNFLRVNQSFGRETGDRVLIETGKYVQTKLPKDCRIYRYGGDQFAVTFPGGAEKEDVFLMMENVRRGYAMPLPDGTSVTLTMGIAAYQDDGAAYAEIVRKAEGAMTRGKTQGHNRVCLARDEKMVTKTAHFTADQLKRLSKVSAKEGTGEAVLLREALDMLLKKYDA